MEKDDDSNNGESWSQRCIRENAEEESEIELMLKIIEAKIENRKLNREITYLGIGAAVIFTGIFLFQYNGCGDQKPKSSNNESSKYYLEKNQDSIRNKDDTVYYVR